jgi:hypothetical protein
LSAGAPARAELESIDVVMIRFQLQRFERRFKYWSERELSGVGVRQ